MTTFQKTSIFLLRVSLGWIMLYAGLVKVINPTWSAIGYLSRAKTFTGFYTWLTSPSILPVVDFLNAWGLTLLGIALILGIGVRLAGILGAALMVLYYFPVLDGLRPNVNSFIIDDHIIYALALLALAAFRAGKYWGLENWCSNLPICKRYRILRDLAR